MLFDWIKRGRDIVAELVTGGPSEVIRCRFNESVYAKYGQMLSLKIDRSTKSASLQILLAGESEPVSVEIGKYHLDDINGKKFVVVDSVTISRQWMNLAAQDYLVGRPLQLSFSLPEIVLKLLL